MKKWPEITDSECNEIEKGDILIHDVSGEFIVANFENLERINGAFWRAIGSLQEGETLCEAIERLKKEAEMWG